MSALFIGRTAELAEINQNIEDGVSTLLIGGRRSGKTTLLGQLSATRGGCVGLDAGEWELGEEAGVLRPLATAVGAEEATRAAIVTAIRANPPLTVLIDEADRILREPWSASFLAWLRAIDGHGPSGLGAKVSFVLAGGPMLQGYDDPEEPGSPALNNARFVYLRPLSRADLQAWLVRAGLDVDLDALRQQVGGQPWLMAQVCRQLALGHDLDTALENTYDQVQPRFETWWRQLGATGVAFLRALPADGHRLADYKRNGSHAKDRDARLLASYLCLVRTDVVGGEERVFPGADLFTTWLRKAPVEAEWDLAISYASEDEETARAIKQALRDEHRVFFAPDEQAWLWAQDLRKVLPKVYGVTARYVLVLSTAPYVAKHWTRVEFDAANQGGATVLLVNLGHLPHDAPKDVVFWQGNAAGLIGLVDGLRSRLQG